MKQKCVELQTIVVLDNLSVHKARPIMQRFDDSFAVKFLTTYSSALNPIEKVWNVVKNEWRKTQHMFALYDYESDQDRERSSLARIKHILGKSIKL